MRGGLIFFGFLIVLAIAPIGGLLYRPATVIGVSDKSLAYSVRGAAGAEETGRCQGSDDKYVCTTFDGSAGAAVPLVITTDEYGCWDGERRGGEAALPETLSGCITIVDLVRLDD